MGPHPALETATGELLKHYGMRSVDFRCQGEKLRTGRHSCRCEAPILSVSKLMDRSIETYIQAGQQFLRRFDGATVELTHRGRLFVLRCHAVVPMLLAPVGEEPAGEAPDLPPIDEKMDRELMGREDVEPPVAIEVPAPDEPTSEERRWTSHICRINLGATSVSELAGEKTDMCHGHKTSQPVIQCDYCFLKTEEDAPRHSAQTDGCHSF